MINVYFSPKIYSIADDLIELAIPKLQHGNAYPKHYAIVDLGIVTLLKSGEKYPMHDDGLNNINIVTFLNNCQIEPFVKSIFNIPFETYAFFQLV